MTPNEVREKLNKLIRAFGEYAIVRSTSSGEGTEASGKEQKSERVSRESAAAKTSK